LSVLPVFLGGLAWKALSGFASQAIRIVVLVVLAHLLTPTDYGLAGMALVFAGLGGIIVDPGIAAAIVQRRELGPLDASTAHWTSAALGLLLGLTGVALAPAIAWFYGEPEVTSLFAVLSLGFFVTGLAVAPTALLTRAQAFRELELSALAGISAGSVVAIAVAAGGGGAWAIVAETLVSGAITTTLIWWLCPSRPFGRFSRAAFREIAAFGAPLLGARVLIYAGRMGDNLLVGRFLGARPLGLYALAYNVILTPFTRVVGPVRDVLFPILARLEDDRARLASIWLRVNRVLAAFFMPAMLGFVVVAPDFVSTILGDRWQPAVPAARLLALVALIQSLLLLTTLVLTVIGRPRTVFSLSLFSTVASIAGFVAGLPWGIAGVAAGYLVATVVVAPAFVVVTSRALELDAWMLPRAVRGIALAAVAMALLVAAFRLLLIEAGVGEAVRLALAVALGVLLYAGLVAWRTREVAAEARALWRAVRSPGSARD
jgi:lipopolysaccharide exporter